MAVHVFTAPAAGGKTTWAIQKVLRATGELRSSPRVCVANRMQKRLWLRRLAESGGALGARVQTFDELCVSILAAAGRPLTQPSPPVLHRFLRAVIDDLPLKHYRSLRDKPGFLSMLSDRIEELKEAQISPDQLSETFAHEPRLAELAQIFSTYEKRLSEKGWTDRAGLGSLALEALRGCHLRSDIEGSLLVFDGFERFAVVQLACMVALADKVNEMYVLLIGPDAEDGRRQLFRRYLQTISRVEKALGVRSAPLPFDNHRTTLFGWLARCLFERTECTEPAHDRFEMIEAPDRPAEARAAIRWLKQRLAHDGVQPGEVALLARDIAPYRVFIGQTAGEFGLPIRFAGGVPLRESPVVAGILDLMRVILPSAGEGGTEGDGGRPALPRRQLIEAWRSPYFDWSCHVGPTDLTPVGIEAGDADALDAAACWGRVLGGIEQWEETLQLLSRQPKTDGDTSDADKWMDVEGPARPPQVPQGEMAEILLAKLKRFVARVSPPSAARSCRDFVAWLESLIGPDPELEGEVSESPPLVIHLRVVHRVRQAGGDVTLAELSALRQLKDVLRGLVWAEDITGDGQRIYYRRFFSELAGAIEATMFELPWAMQRDEILVANTDQARGLAFRSVAVLGMAEGEFPKVLHEDPLLRDGDRAQLRDGLGDPLSPSTESGEMGLFYETVARPWEKLLLTRPRLEENGAPWIPSPFWDEIRRRVALQPRHLTSETLPQPSEAASLVELMEILASRLDAHPSQTLPAWFDGELGEALVRLEVAGKLLHDRASRKGSPYDGDLSRKASLLAQMFGAEQIWSSSQMENYRTCPYAFFVSHVLKLKERPEPAVGLDGRQLGLIYHRIFERLYKSIGGSDPQDVEVLLEALPAVAGEVLDEAPQGDGFRVAAWWEHTRREIVENARRSVSALQELASDYQPIAHEQRFAGRWALLVRGEGGVIRIRGVIDRIDRAPDGTLRVIDYKTSGPSRYSEAALKAGEIVQLPLYALAARDALGLGEPADGFYWHVLQAKKSPFSLANFEGGPHGAISLAVRHCWEAVAGIRKGLFRPAPQKNGCPNYCPARGFCWLFRAAYGGQA